MATFKELSANDIKAASSFLEQVIDVIQEDISGSSTRKTYQHFVTGGVGPGVTSSLWQTAYDQDFSLQTANSIFDMTVGLYFSGATVQDIKTGEDSSGKLLFPSTSIMMREKMDIHNQYSQALLGNQTSQFRAPFNSSDATDDMDEVMFINVHRLFSRDGIKRETFAMQWYESGTVSDGSTGLPFNLALTSETGVRIYTDAGSAGNKEQTFGGNVGNIVDSSNTNRTVGLLFYDQGIGVLDLAKITSGSQRMVGVIDAMSAVATGSALAGQVEMGTPGAANPNAKLIPDLMTSGSIDNIVDHLAISRFSSGTLTAMTFQNLTNIHSTLIFCRATADEMNYSANPTYVDSDTRIVVIDEGQEENQQSFTMVTSVGLYDANDNLLAVAKLSRPVEKNPEKDLTVRVRLDF
jgi:hypothetical protein